MQSKGKRAMTALERAHVERVARQACAVCRAPGPSEVHEIKQGSWYTSVSLCRWCHRGRSGIHGDRAMWALAKLDELGALNETLRMVAEDRARGVR